MPADWKARVDAVWLALVKLTAEHGVPNRFAAAEVAGAATLPIGAVYRVGRFYCHQLGGVTYERGWFTVTAEASR